MARFARSAILYRQMRGRGTRKAEHIGKTGFTIFDFVGVMVAKGVYRAERDPRMLLTLDVDDHIDPSTCEWLTLNEHGRIVRTPEHEARAAKIGLRAGRVRRPTRPSLMGIGGCATRAMPGSRASRRCRANYCAGPRGHMH